MIFFLISCKNEYSSFEKELTKNNNCWIFIENPATFKINNDMYGGNSFSIDGKVESVYIIKGVKQESFNFEKSQKTDNRWSYNKEHLLIFYGYKFKILKFKKDTIIVKNIKYNKQQLFLNKPGQSQ